MPRLPIPSLFKKFLPSSSVSTTRKDTAPDLHVHSSVPSYTQRIGAAGSKQLLEMQRSDLENLKKSFKEKQERYRELRKNAQPNSLEKLKYIDKGTLLESNYHKKKKLIIDIYSLCTVIGTIKNQLKSGNAFIVSSPP
jgi:hypothetical protein